MKNCFYIKCENKEIHYLNGGFNIHTKVGNTEHDKENKSFYRYQYPIYSYIKKCLDNNKKGIDFSTKLAISCQTSLHESGISDLVIEKIKYD